MRRILPTLLLFVLAGAPAGAHQQEPRVARFVGVRAAAAVVDLVDSDGRGHGRFAFYVQSEGVSVVNDSAASAEPVAESLWAGNPSALPHIAASEATVDINPLTGGTATFTHAGVPVSLRFTPYGDPYVMRGDGFGVWTSWHDGESRHLRDMCVAGTAIRGMLVEGTVGQLTVIGPAEVPWFSPPHALIGSLRAETHIDVDTPCIVTARIPSLPISA